MTIKLDDPHFESHAQEWRDNELDKYLAEGDEEDESPEEEEGSDE